MRLLVLCALLLSSLPARAERAFATNLNVEVPVTAAGAVLWIVSEGLKPKLAPADCRLCARNALDRAVQEGLMWQNVQPARRLSDALLFGLVPAFAGVSVAALGYAEGKPRSAGENTIVLGEAVVATAVITQLLKYTVARERPFLRTQRDSGELVTHGPDDNLSFFSGHTSITFALAVGAGSIASFREYKHAPWIWALGMPLAALSGYLRIAADRHYFTDVLTGALVGSAVGVLIPWLHRHYAHTDGPRVSASPPGMLTMTWLL
ncbi:MAG TPA: phosphatase PAP2 family protein [Polyangiales bacterium]|nr:phosphatase PAP2 family protein [Polyangiales bacterium]